MRHFTPRLPKIVPTLAITLLAAGLGAALGRDSSSPAAPLGRIVPAGQLAARRFDQTATLLPDGRVLVVGGSNRLAWHGEHASAELFDPATGRFSRTGDMAHARFKLRDGVVRLPGGEVLVAGGAERAELFDPATGSFHAVAGGPLEGFLFSTATLLPDSTVLIAGGYGDDPGRGGFASAWLYRMR